MNRRVSVVDQDLPFKLLAENSPDGVSRFDNCCRYLYANSTVEQLLNYQAVLLVGKTHAELGISNVLSDTWDKAIQMVLSTGQSVKFECCPTTQDCKFYQIIALAERHPNGEVTAVLVISRDLTQLKQSQAVPSLSPTQSVIKGNQSSLTGENQRLRQKLLLSRLQAQELRASEAKFASVFHFSPDAIAISTFPAGHYLEVNHGFGLLTEYSAPEVTGCTDHDLGLWVEPSQQDLFLKTLRLTGTNRNYQCQFKTKSGQVKSVLISAEILQLNGQQCLLTITRDITYLKQTEFALRESEERFRSIFDNVSVGIALINTNGYVVAANEADCNFLGYMQTELVGMHFTEFTHPDDLSLDSELFAALTRRERDYYTIDKRYIRKDARIVWGRLTLSLLFNEDNSIRYVMVVCEDITDRKQVELQLQAMNDRLQFLLLASPVIIFCCKPDDNYRMTFISENVRAILGYGSQVFLSEPGFWLQQVHPDDIDCLLAHSDQFFEQGFHSQEYRFRRADGTYCWLYTKMCLFQNDDGQPSEIVGYLLDISDRKHTEEALRTSEERWQLALQGNNDGIWDHNLLTDEHFLSPRCMEMLGYEFQQIDTFGKWLQYVHPEDVSVLKQSFAQHTKGETPYYVAEYRMRCQNGDYKWLLTRGLVYRNSHGQPMRAVGSITDITVQKETEALLLKQAERERIISTVTQRIRQSLNLHEILSTTVTEVRQLLQTDRVLIYRLDSESSGTVLVESVGSGWVSMLNQHIADPCFGKSYVALYQRGEITQRTDLYAENVAQCYIDLLKPFQVRANLIVPILQDQRLWGLLIAHQCGGPRHWQAFELNLLQQLATQVAIAIQQSELYHQVSRLNADLENQVQQRTNELYQALNFEALLKRITDKVRDSLDESQILQAAVTEVAIGLDLSCCDAALYDLVARTSTISYEFIRAAILPAKGTTVVLADKPGIYNQLLQGQYVQFCLAYLDEFNSCRIRLKHESTILACPIIDERGVLGDLWLFKPQSECFSTIEIRLVQQVANQCAISLRQARLYQAAQAQVTELERLNRLKDDFLSTVSHELRTPMASIKMATQMLDISFQQLKTSLTETSSMERYLQILNDECDRETHLINDLLDLCRLDSKTEPLQLLTMDLPNWILHVSEPFLERTRSQQQTLTFEFAPEVTTLTTDFSYLQRILTELLTNACKYTPSGESITVATKKAPCKYVEPASNDLHFTVPLSMPPISSADLMQTCQIIITNTGVELPKQECEHIFDKFYRVLNNDPWKYGGTGLGLALVKKLVEQLGGSIQVESNDQHVTFCLELTYQ